MSLRTLFFGTAPKRQWLPGLGWYDFSNNGLIFGKTGSGKSTLMRRLIECAAADGHGMFVNNFKAADSEWLLGVLRRYKREVVLFEPNGLATVNVLGATVAGLDPASQAVRDEGVLTDIAAAVSRSRSGGDSDGGFWAAGGAECLREACSAYRHAGEVPTPAKLRQFIVASPAHPAACATAEFKSGECYRVLKKGSLASIGTGNSESCLATSVYWTEQRPQIPERTWGGYQAHALVPLSILCTGEVARVLGAERPTVDLARAVEAGAVVVCNFPNATFGKLSDAVTRGLWSALQNVALARRVTPQSKPFISFVDELPRVITATDARFFSLSRSSLAPTVGAVQGIESLRDAMPGSGDGATEVIVGNCGVAVHCTPTDATRKWLCDQLGTEERLMMGGSSSGKAYPDAASLFDQGGNGNASWSTTFVPVLTPGEIQLRCGSNADGGVVDAIVTGPAHCHPFRVISHKRNEK